MSNKLIWSAGVIIVLAIVIFLNRENGQAPSSGKGPGITRQANRVVMFERKRESGKVLEVSAREVDETEDQVAHLRDYTLTHSGDLTLSGSEAVYDRNRSVLELKGKVTMKRTNGDQAEVVGLLWDRKAGTAHTDNPVSYRGGTGFITADRAEFSQDFTRIAFIGRVHARIMQDFLTP